MADPLWKNLSKPDFYRYSAEFMSYSSNDISLLYGEQFSIFMQWLLEFGGKETLKAVTKGRATNLIVVDKNSRNYHEFVRAYYGTASIPANSLQDLYKKIEQKNYANVYIFTLCIFTDRQKQYNRDLRKPMMLMDQKQFFKAYLLAKINFSTELKERKGKSVGKGLLGLINRPKPSQNRKK